MGQSYSDFFQIEKNLLNETKRQMKTKRHDHEALLNMLSAVIGQFEKTIRDVEKVIKISDIQQYRLHESQNKLKTQIKECMLTEKKLSYMASTDVLTNCYNRRIGLRYLKSELEAGKRNKDIFTICYIDVNKLKYVNDNYGHSEGDELLILVCKFIRDILECNDILCRLGGDEFLIIFPSTKEKKAQEIMDKVMLLANIENDNKIKPYNISFSYGMLQINPDDSLSVDEIIKKADKLMYENKAALR